MPAAGLLYETQPALAASAAATSQPCRAVVDPGRQSCMVQSDSQCCLPACGRLAAPSPWRPPSAGPPCSTRLVDHTGRAARGPGPVTVAACQGRRGRACSPYTAWRRCLPETSSPRPRLLASPSGVGMVLGAPLPGLTLVVSDRRSGLVVARAPGSQDLLACWSLGTRRITPTYALMLVLLT